MQHKKLVQRFEGANEDKLKCAAICTKQKKLLITGGADANVSIWLLSKLEPITILRGQKSAITCLTSHPNESYIAGGSVDGTIKIWDLAQNGKAVRTFGCAEGTGCVGIQFHPLVDILAVMSSNFSVHLWDFRQRRCIKQIPAVLFQGKEKRKQSLSILPCLQFSPDGKWFCYSSISEESTLHVWDLSSGKEIQALAHPIEEGLICSLVFHPRHMIMITGTQAGNIRVWDMSSFRNLCTFAPLQTLSDESQHEDGVRMIFNAEGNVLFVYKGNWMERLYCSPEDLFNLHSIDTIRSECKTIPHHLVLSGTSLLSICCDSSSAFSLWVTNATLDRKDIPNPNEPSEVAEELTETYELPPTLPVLPKNQKILVDRQNSPFALDIQSFCSDILSDCEIRGTSEEKALAELTGDSHKQFIAAMNGRLRVVKPLQNLTKKSDIPGILNLFARMKDIDLAILAVSIDSCLPSLEKATLQLEHLNSFNSLLLLLLRSAENRYIATALQCLTKLVVTYGNILNRSNKLRESLQQSQQLAQDANQPMPTRIAARGACRAFKSAR